MSELTEDEREALAEAIPGLLEGAAVADLDDDSTPDEVFRAVASNILVSDWLAEYVAARISAVEQERDKAKQMLDGWQKTALQLRDQHEHEFNRAEAAEQERDSVQFALDGFRQVAQKDNEYLIARAKAAEQRVVESEAAVLALAEKCDTEKNHDDATGYVFTSDLRALVSDPTALDRVRQEAVEAALAPIEALDVTLEWYASDKPLFSADQLRQALVAARDAAGVSSETN